MRETISINKRLQVLPSVLVLLTALGCSSEIKGPGDGNETPGDIASIAPKNVWHIGSMGQESGQFANPLGVAVHNSQIYVADNRNRRLQVFDQQGNHFANLVGFSSPTRLDIDENGNIYVVDHGFSVSRIAKLDAFGGPEGNCASYSPEITSPCCVTVSPDGSMYVLVIENPLVSIDGTVHGRRVLRIHSSCGGPLADTWSGPLIDPILQKVVDLETDEGGNLYIASGSAVHKYSSTQVPLASYLLDEDASGVAVDSNGDVYASTENMIYKFSGQSGSLVWRLTLQPPYESAQLVGIAVASDGQMIVAADVVGHRIIVLEYE